MAGRSPIYHSQDQRPVSVSLRIPRALYEQVQERVHMRRMTLTETLLEGLQLWLEQPADPRELLLYESNTVMQELREELKETLLDELRKDVQRLLTSATHTSPVVPCGTFPPHSHCTTVSHEIQHTEASVPDGLRRCKSGLHTYPATLRECPECRRATKQAYKQRQRAKAQTQPQAPTGKEAVLARINERLQALGPCVPKK
jgi:hypothetical protein